MSVATRGRHDTACLRRGCETPRGQCLFSASGDQLESDDAGQNEGNAQYPHGGRGVAQ